MRNASTYAVRSIATLLSFLILYNQSLNALPPPRPFLQSAQTASGAATPDPAHPSQILHAHKIFLANEGADANFPITADASYNAVRSSLQTWGFYQLVESPGEADLIFRLRAIAPITGISGSENSTSASVTPAFEIKIADPVTQVTLWTITSEIGQAARRKTLDQNVASAAATLTARIKVLIGQPLGRGESAAPEKAHRGISGLLLLALLLVPLAIGGISYYFAKRSADDFATANKLTCATNPFFCTH